MLNRSGKNGPLCLTPDLGEKAFSLSPLNMLAMDFFWGGSLSIINLRKFSSEYFYHERVLGFIEDFSAFIEMSLISFNLDLSLSFSVSFMN